MVPMTLTLAMQAQAEPADDDWWFLTSVVAGLVAALTIGWVVIRRVLLDGGSRR